MFFYCPKMSFLIRFVSFSYLSFLVILSTLLMLISTHKGLEVSHWFSPIQIRPHEAVFQLVKVRSGTGAKRSFIKRQTGGTSSDNEWYNEWQRVVQRVTKNDNEWYNERRVVKTGIGTWSDNEWYNEWQRVVQRVTLNDSERFNEWQRMMTSGASERVILGFEMKQKVSLVPEGFCSIFNQCVTKYIQQYRLFVNREIDDIIYGQYNILRFYHAGFFHVFRYQFCWNLLKQVKLIVKYERLFENIM